MALTKIKETGIADDAVTAGKIAAGAVVADITTGSVTATHLAGSIPLSKTNLTAGNGISIATDTVSVSSTLGHVTGVGTLGSLTVSGVASLGHNSKATSSDSDTTFKIETTSGTSIFPVLDFVSSHSSVGGKIRQDGSDVISFDNSQNATFAGELRVNGGQASIYGAEGSNAILELNSDEADDNADRWQMYVFNTNNYLKWRHYSTGSWVDRLWLSSATDNWALNLTAAGAYGMQITTASDSATTDAFGIRRNSSAKVFEILNNGKILCTRQLHIDTDSASVYPSIVGETSNYELFRLEQWHGNEGSLVLKRDGSNKIRFTGGQSGVTSFINNGASFCIGREDALSPVARLVVASALDGGTTPAASFQANTNTGSGAVIVFHAGDGTEEGNVFMSNLNAGTGVSYTSSSDYRLKEKVKTLPNALDRVNQMKPVEFVWKKAQIKSEGFLAHELQEICDYAVHGEKDGDKMQQADYAKITPILVKAVQELSAKVTALEKN